MFNYFFISAVFAFFTVALVRVCDVIEGVAQSAAVVAGLDFHILMRVELACAVACFYSYPVVTVLVADAHIGIAVALVIIVVDIYGA